MNVSLTPKLERFVHEKVESGMYQTASEVVRDGLRLLKERDDEQALFWAEANKKIEEGLESLRAGRYTKYDEESLDELFEGIKRRGRERLQQKRRRVLNGPLPSR
jgi:antitoxin ParD1/3/4